MSLAFTAFISQIVNAYPTDTPDPFFATYCDTLNGESRYRLTTKQIAPVFMNLGDSKVFTQANAALADWQLVVIRASGAFRVETVAKDTDGTSTINGRLPVYGNDLYPGILLFSTYNITSFTLTCQADASKAEIFVATCGD